MGPGFLLASRILSQDWEGVGTGLHLQEDTCSQRRTNFAISFENMGEPQCGHCVEPPVSVFSDFTPVHELTGPHILPSDVLF